MRHTHSIIRTRRLRCYGGFTARPPVEVALPAATADGGGVMAGSQQGPQCRWRYLLPLLTRGGGRGEEEGELCGFTAGQHPSDCSPSPAATAAAFLFLSASSSL